MNHKKLLFEMFQQRGDVERISSDPKQLVFDDHCKSLSKITHTDIGFWLKLRDRYIGAVNISYENSLGIYLFAKYENYLGQLFYKICKKSNHF